MPTEGISKEIWQFAAGCSRQSPPSAFCALHAKKLAAIGVPMSSFAFYRDGKWFSREMMPEWNAIAMASTPIGSGSSAIVAALGEGGQLWEYDAESTRETVGQLPRTFGLTNLASINNTLYACGMGRVVFERQMDGEWSDISAPWPDSKEGIIGFTDLAGHPVLGLISVGWQGEVWTRNGGSWHRVDTPTNANLNAVDVSPDGTVYCVGDRGAMLAWRNDGWEVLDTGTIANLQDVCCSDPAVYVSTDFNVLVLGAQGLEEDSGFDVDDVPATCLKVFSVQGVGLCSIGPNDAFLKRDGVWTRIA